MYNLVCNKFIPFYFKKERLCNFSPRIYMYLGHDVKNKNGEKRLIKPLARNWNSASRILVILLCKEVGCQSWHVWYPWNSSLQLK